MHVEIDVASDTLENVFTGHLSHCAFPFTSPAYVPARQEKHCVCATRPCVDFPAGHVMHSCVPLDSILFRNFPAKQSIHVVCELAPDCIEYFPSTHLVQVSSDIAADTVEYFPSTQLVQLTSELAVDAVEYVPAKHWEHVPPFAPVNPALH